MGVRWLAVGVGAAGFGVADAAAWDHQVTSQAWFWVANMSSAYLLLAYAAGALTTRTAPRRTPDLQRRDRHRTATALLAAAAAGVAATLVALAGFYAAQLATGHQSTMTVAAPLRRYAAPGLVTGALFGALGGWAVHRRAWWTLAVLAAALVGEPLAWRAHLEFLPGPTQVWAGEAATGGLLAVAAAVMSVRELRTQRAPRAARGVARS